MQRTIGSHGAKIMFLGNWPTKTDLYSMKSFSGAGGDLLKRMLKQADISPAECLFSNCVPNVPVNGVRSFFANAGMSKPTEAFKNVKTEVYDDIQKYSPNVVVAMGDFATKIMLDVNGLKSFRGSIMESTLIPRLKVISTYHTTDLFRDWKQTFPALMDIRKAKRHMESPDMPKEQRFLIVDADFHKFMEYVEDLITNPENEHIVFDIETKPPGQHIDWIGFAHNENFAMNIKLLSGKTPMLTENQELELWSALARLFACKDKKFIAQNGQYDVSILTKNHGITPDLYFDTMLAAHTCWPQLPKSLAFLASICLDIPAWKHTVENDRGMYNAVDCTSTFGIFNFLKAEMIKQDVMDTFNLEMSQIELATLLGLQGIRIDEGKKNKLRVKAMDEITEVDTQLFAVTKDKEINYKSPKQVAKLLYETFSLPPQFKKRHNIREAKTYTTDDRALDVVIRKSEHDLPKLIKKHRKLSKRIDTHLKPVANPETGCVYTSYNICGKDTQKSDEYAQSMGRWSSSRTIVWDDIFNAGNLQAIPYLIRKMYIPEPGNVIIQADLKQAEAVAVAYFTNDERSKQAFRNGEDVHNVSAGVFYGIPSNEVSDEKYSAQLIGKDFSQRDIGKRGKHAINYMGGPGVLAMILNINMTDARKIYDRMITVNPYIPNYHETIKRQLKQDLTLITPAPFNRKRRFLEKWGEPLFRSACAYLPQSTVGDLLNSSMVEFYNLYGEIYKILLQLHDAMYVECNPDPKHIVQLIQSLKECMTKEITINGDIMVIDVDFSIGTTWGDMVDIKIQDHGRLFIKHKNWKEWKPYSYNELVETAKL